jgi:hypothetical protein
MGEPFSLALEQLAAGGRLYVDRLN